MLLIGLGHKARHGKDTFANTVKEHFGATLDIRLHSFADPLRAEVTEEAYRIWERTYPGHLFNPQRAMELVCDFYDQPFDPFAEVDETYPWGKQRVLLQWWGTDYRRAQDPQYWTSKGRALIHEARASGADACIFRDMRFYNEFYLIGDEGGRRIDVERRNFDSGVPPHISEFELDNAPFDLRLSVDNGDLQKLKDSAVEIFSQLYANQLSPAL